MANEVLPGVTNEVLVCRFESGVGDVLVARLLAGPNGDSKKVFEQYLKESGQPKVGVRHFTFNIKRMKFQLPGWISNPDNLPPATR